MKSHFVLIVLLSLSLTVESEDDERRLPDSVWPVDYDLHVEPDHSNDRFSGRVTITVVASKETSEIKLHSDQLRINSVTVTDKNGNSLQVQLFYLQKILQSYDIGQFLIIKLAEHNRLKPGQQYSVAISFNGSLDDNAGYFKGSYQIDNRKSNYSVTRFKPENIIDTFARKVFPCFDEPQFKATFRLSLTHDRDLVALSNMPEESSEQSDGDKKTTTFVRSTIKIPTHLIGWAVGEFAAIKQTTSNGLKVRSFSRPDQTERTRFLLSTTVKLVEFYERLFEIPYPLPKLDLLVLDKDVLSSETVGIHGFTSNLEFNSKLTSADQIKDIVQKISVAMAKSWFGTLLTMSSWNEAALIDGLTDFLMHKALSSQSFEIDNVKWPNDFKDFFVIDQLQTAIEKDSKNDSHPIAIPSKESNVPPIVETRIVNDFKASATLRMIEVLIGEEAFVSAVKSYLTKYRDSTAGVKEFFYEIDAVFDKSMFGDKINNINDCMKKWFYDKNLPVVSVSRSANGLLVEQHRFVIKDDSKNELTDWIIPIKVITGNGVTSTFILNKQSDEINIQIDENDWFKLNAGSVGYYLVNYQPEDWQRLTGILSHNPNMLSPADRANLIFDAFQLIKANRLKYSIAFDLLSFLTDDDHLIPWTIAYNQLTERMKKTVTESNEKQCLYQLSQQLSAKLYQKLGWNDAQQLEEQLDKRILRINTLHLSCRSGSTDCLDAAAERLSKLIQNSDSIGPDTRVHVYRYGVQRRGQQIDRSEVQWLLNRYAAESWNIESFGIATGLKIIQSQERQFEVFQSILNGNSPIPLSHFSDHLESIILHSPVGQRIVWSFLRDNWDRIPEKDVVDKKWLLMNMFHKLNRQEQLDEAVEFLRRHPNVTVLKNTPEKYLNRIRKNIQRRLSTGSDETACLNWQQRVEVTRPIENKPANVGSSDDQEDDSAFDAFDLFED